MGSKLYSEHAEEYSRAIRDNLYNALYERPSLMSMLPAVRGLSVLDMGCGSGVYAEELLKRGAVVTALDSSPEMLAILRATLGDRVRAYVQDLENGLPQECDDEFDLVVSPLVIHYVKDIEKLFGEVARVLKPGGIFLFSTHHPMVDFNFSVSGNYFDTELLTQSWNTIGTPVEVQYYRRPLTELFKAIKSSGMTVASLNEGVPDKRMKEVSEYTYKKLSTNPGFVFLMCMNGRSNGSKEKQNE